MRLAIEAAKSIKKSYDQDVHNLDRKHLTNIPRQEYENPTVPQKAARRWEMTYAQATINSTETPKISANNTQENTIMKLMQESSTRFETLLSKQAE
jgi:hypothetical protein